MEGTESHNKSIGYFKVISATPPTQPPGGGGGCDPSGSVNGTATPNSGGPGTTITFRGTGFSQGEGVSYWFTLPSGIVVGTAQPVEGGVNPDGSVILTLTLNQQIVNLGTGKWALTFEGANSHHQSIIYFCVHQ
jgi:hypothetical protein